MAREPFKPVELTEAYRPVATPVDSFVQAQVPSRDTTLQDLARSLSTLGGSLGELMGKRDREAEENDRLQGEAAFHASKRQGFAEAVATGVVPPQYSQSFMQGYKQAQGEVAGAELAQKYAAAYDAWDQKTNADPKAYDAFTASFIADNIQTQDKDILRGLMPKVKQISENYLQRHIGDVSRATMQGALETEAARNDQLIKAASSAGLGAKTGMDYAGTFGTIEANRAAALSRGVNKDKYDQQVVDGITSAAIELGDRKVLDFLDRKVPGADFTWSNTPYGQDAKRKAIETIDTAARKAVVEAERTRREQKAELKEAVTRDTILAITKDPRAPVPEELLARGEKVDPDFRINAIRWRDTIGRQGQTSDPEDLLAVTSDILNGGGLQRVQKAMRDGVFKNPEDLTRAYKLAEGMTKEGPKLDEMLRVGTAKTILDTLKKRTATEKDASKILFDDGSMSNEGLQATSDYKQALMNWLLENPDAGSLDREKAAQTIGATFLERLQFPEGPMGSTVYKRDGLNSPNTFNAAAPAPVKPAAPATPPAESPGLFERAKRALGFDSTPATPAPAPTAAPPGSTPPVPATAPVPAPAAPTAAPAVPAPQPATPTAPPVAPAAPPTAAPVAAQPPAPPAQAHRALPVAKPNDPAPLNAQDWFAKEPPETRAVLEKMATKQGQPLDALIAQAYQTGLAKGSIKPPPAAGGGAPAAAPATAAPVAPGRQSSMAAPDGTPIETASARTGDDTVTREVIESFHRAVGPAITRDQAAKAPRIEGGAPPTPIPVSLKTEKGSIPVPANSAVAMVDDGPRGHINHGVISLKAPDGSILGQYRFVNGGGGGAGTIPHGAYDVTNFRDAASRQAQGLTNIGDTFDLNDVFDARAGRTRTALRIHQAHGDGTLGCIGIQGGDAAWRDFTGKMRALVEQGGGKYTLVLGSEEGGGGQGQGQTAQEGFSRVLGTTGKAVGGYASPELKADTRAARILDFVAGAELNQANGGNYNAFFGNAGATEDLSKRTLNQTIAWSRDRGTSSSATGRYQFMADTMVGLKKELGLTGSEAFTPELQDRMALRLLERRGYRDYATGKLSAEDFANNLAKEWASLPNLTTGRSHYAGDGVNKALVSPEQVRSVLEGTGAFPGARLASVARTLTAPGAGSRLLSRVRGMFGDGSGPEVTSAPVPEPAPVTTRPAPLPASVQAGHAHVLASLEPDVAAVVRRAQADNPNLRLVAWAGRGGSVEVRAVGPDGRAIPVGDGDEVGAALQRAAGQLGVGVNWASGTRTLSSVKKTLKA